MQNGLFNHKVTNHNLKDKVSSVNVKKRDAPIISICFHRKHFFRKEKSYIFLIKDNTLDQWEYFHRL